MKFAFIYLGTTTSSVIEFSFLYNNIFVTSVDDMRELSNSYKWMHVIYIKNVFKFSLMTTKTHTLVHLTYTTTATLRHTYVVYYRHTCINTYFKK